jgi:hypothetical protein
VRSSSLVTLQLAAIYTALTVIARAMWKKKPQLGL